MRAPAIKRNWRLDALFFPGSILCQYERRLTFNRPADAFTSYVPNPDVDAFFRRKWFSRKWFLKLRTQNHMRHLYEHRR